MDRNQALSKAMALCSRQEYSESAIRHKLEYWDVISEDIEWIITRLIQEKFIDDLRYTTAFVRDKVKINHWGRIKIRYMLSMERIKPSVIDQAMNAIDEEIYDAVLHDLLSKKIALLKKETDPLVRRQKLIKYAQGRGFEVEKILLQLKKLTH